MSIKAERKTVVIADNKTSANDTGSPEVQIAILTERINNLSKHMETNKKDFTNAPRELPEALKDYLNSVEILNRQSLPLRPNFNQKVQTYFRKDDKL